MLLPELRKVVSDLHMELPKNNLVAWTSGNISARDPESGLIVIKPSGIKFEDLTPENMVVVNVDGEIMESDYKASSDTASIPAPNGSKFHFRLVSNGSLPLLSQVSSRASSASTARVSRTSP